MKQKVYGTLEAYLNGKDRRSVRKTGTFVQREVDSLGAVCIRLYYHDTAVVTALADGTVLLNTGGWETKTTQDRMESALRPLWDLAPDGYGMTVRVSGTWETVRGVPKKYRPWHVTVATFNRETGERAERTIGRFINGQCIIHESDVVPSADLAVV